MTLRRFILAALVVPFGLLVPCVAGAASESAIDGVAMHAHVASCSASRERVPSPHTTIVPAVIVLAAIGATVARMNRRGGPR